MRYVKLIKLASTPSLCLQTIAFHAAMYLVLLPLPTHLVVAVLALLRGESDFVWNYSSHWTPFPSTQGIAAFGGIEAESLDEKDKSRSP